MAQFITKFGYLKDNKTRSRGGYHTYVDTSAPVQNNG